MGKPTPIQINVDKPGNHTILVCKDGYLDETGALNLQAGQSYRFTPALRALGATSEIKIKKFMGGGAPEGSDGQHQDPAEGRAGPSIAGSS